jgi:type II secretory pathway component HofQ
MIVELRQLESDASQWSIIELQGNLLTSDGSQIETLDVGIFKFNETGVPVLTIGPHILEGKIEKLSPPLLIIQKDETATVAAGAEMEEETEQGSNNQNVAYIVAGEAHQKILFKSRPKIGLRT